MTVECLNLELKNVDLDPEPDPKLDPINPAVVVVINTDPMPFSFSVRELDP
jgi:hypothetical protein